MKKTTSKSKVAKKSEKSEKSVPQPRVQRDDAEERAIFAKRKKLTPERALLVRKRLKQLTPKVEKGQMTWTEVYKRIASDPKILTTCRLVRNCRDSQSFCHTEKGIAEAMSKKSGKKSLKK